MECRGILGYWVPFQHSALTYNHLPHNELIKCPLMTTCSLGDRTSKNFSLANIPLSHQACCWQVIFFPLLSKVIFPFLCSSCSQLSFTIQNNSLNSALLYYKYFHPLFKLFCKLYIIGSFNFSSLSWPAIYFPILLSSFIEFFVILFFFFF